MKNKKTALIFMIVYIAYTSIYVARLNLSMAAPGLKDAAILDSAQIGILGSVFSVVFAIGRFLNGRLSDTKPPWIMISTGLAVAGISNIVAGFFPPFAGMMLLWMVNAFAQSMLWSSVLCVVSSLYDEQKAKKMTSYMVTSVATGNIAAILINTYIITTFGLNFAFVMPGLLTIIMSTFVFLSIKKIKAPNANSENHMSMHKLLENKEIKMTLIPTLLHGIIKDNISLWMTVYFVDKFEINLEQSALFVLFIPVIGLIGRMLYPACYKVCKDNEQRVALLAFVICAIAAIPLAFGWVTPFVAAFCLSLIYAAASIINTSLVSIFPIRYLETGNVASLSGLMDLATYMGTGIGSFAYGFIIDKAGYSPMYISWIVIAAVSIVLLKKLLKKN